MDRLGPRALPASAGLPSIDARAGFPGRAPIVCLEGPSAIGKTTLAARLQAEVGAAVIPELDAADAPPIANSAGWYIDAHAAHWQRARELALLRPLVVIDGDLMKGLWFNWVFSDQGWPGVHAQKERHESHLAAGTLAFPDLYVVLLATEEQLRARRAGDVTRSRRNHEMHLRLIEPQRRYFEALRAVEPARVLMLDTAARDALVPGVLAAARALPPEAPDSLRLYAHMARWVRDHEPV